MNLERMIYLIYALQCATFILVFSDQLKRVLFHYYKRK